MTNTSVPAQYESVVIAHTPLCDEHGCVQLRVPRRFRARAGQFIQILCRDPASLRRGDGYLRRPFSIAALRDSGSHAVLDVVYRVIGPGTAWLDERRPNDVVNVIGPLGNGFWVPESCTNAYLVAGGVGHPPILMMGHELAARNVARVGFHGARSANLMPLTFSGPPPAGGTTVEPTFSAREWAESNTPVIPATEDGSIGFAGNVVQAMEAHFAANPIDPSSWVIYGCGPAPMLKAVAHAAQQWGARCQVALEATMACGMGTCQSCVVRVRDADAPDGWRYRLCCTDGPVFWGESIIW